MWEKKKVSILYKQWLSVHKSLCFDQKNEILRIRVISELPLNGVWLFLRDGLLKNTSVCPWKS